MVETWMIALIPFAIGVIFAAGSFYQKIKGMDSDIKAVKDDIKSIKNELKEMGESKNIHNRLINSQQASFSAYIDAFQSLTVILVRNNQAIATDLINLQSKLTSDTINKTLQAIAGGIGNPVSAEEANKLRLYVERARANQIFTPEEAQDFYNLSQRVSQDRSDDAGAWAILLLAAFILALYVLSKKK